MSREHETYCARCDSWHAWRHQDGIARRQELATVFDLDVPSAFINEEAE